MKNRSTSGDHVQTPSPLSNVMKFLITTKAFELFGSRASCEVNEPGPKIL